MDKWIQVEQNETFVIKMDELDEYLESYNSDYWIETGEITLLYSYVINGVTGTSYDTVEKLIEIEGK